MNYHFVSLLIDFVMEKISPVKISPKNYSLGTKTNPVDFSVPLRTIAYLIKHVIIYNILRVMDLMEKIINYHKFLNKDYST